MKPNSLHKQIFNALFLSLVLCFIITLFCWQQIEQGFYALIICLALIYGLTVVLTHLFSKKLTQPVQAIISEAQAMSQGDFSKKVRLSSPAELAELANTLNEMGNQLKETIQKLTYERNIREAILSSMVEGVVAINPKGQILTVNQAARQMLNITQDDAQGKSLVEVIRISDLQLFLQEILNSKQIQQAQFQLFSPRECFLNVNGTPLENDKGEQIGALAVLNDITDIARLSEMRKRFVADVSHELKTPITAIKGFVETLQDGALDDSKQAERFLEIIATHIDRLNAIIEDLLSLSRLEACEQKISLQPITILPIIHKSISNYQIAAEDKGLKLLFTSAADNFQIMGNEQLIESAINNLLDNAIKYSPSTGKIEISCQAAKDMLTIKIKDYGIGIPENDLPHIFERFYRVEKGRSRQMGGTGLGLAIVKHVTLAHHGSVEVSSKVNEGSVFSLQLPLI